MHRMGVLKHCINRSNSIAKLFIEDPVLLKNIAEKIIRPKALFRDTTVFQGSVLEESGKSERLRAFNPLHPRFFRLEFLCCRVCSDVFSPTATLCFCYFIHFSRRIFAVRIF